ncbi:MAG: hypothetical protein GX638_01645 [Crenarchaeota archaeon]|nr:hypothetical protein [Thermoproteota archaeon]
MNTKKLALTIVLAALTVALNPVISGIGVPAPYMPFLIYGIWEIPIVVAFLLIGPASGIAVSVLNAVTLLAYANALPLAPFYNLAAIMCMLLGIFTSEKLIKKGTLKIRNAAAVVVIGTTIGIFFRLALMTTLNYVTLQQPYPIGYELSMQAITAMLPAIGLFNATVVLYTVPVAYTIVKTIKGNTRLNLE